MPYTDPTTIRPSDVLQTFIHHPRRWAIPLVLGGLLGLFYAYTRPNVWEGTQALLVRDEAVNKDGRLGKFTAADDMKTVQETVLELIKSRNVIAGALADVGPPADYTSTVPWPSPTIIELVRPTIKLSPPKGAEFGKTEVFYLQVLSPDRQRAIDLAKALCHELQTQFNELRYKKYQGIIRELKNTVKMAKADLEQSTNELAAVEREAGPDLAELRILNETPSNDSGLRRVLGEIELELRNYRGQVAQNQQLLDLLKAAQENPGQLLASPSKLLESQPALRRLKDGLVDAQLRTSLLLGTMNPDHPSVVAARASEEEIGSHLHDEIGIALDGVQLDMQLAEQRVTKLEEQRKSLQERLAHLAEIRAQYSNLVAISRHRTEILKNAQQDLAAAEAIEATARTANLITTVDEADTGTRPVGPTKRAVLFVGLLGGLLTGLGLVVFTTRPIPVTTPELPHAIASEPVAMSCNVSSTPPGVIPAGSMSLRQALNKLVHRRATHR